MSVVLGDSTFFMGEVCVHEAWTMRKVGQYLLERTEVRMLMGIERIERIEKIKYGRDQIKRMSRCGKWEYENWRSETEMKDRGRCSDENMEVGGQRKTGSPKLEWRDTTQKAMKLMKKTRVQRGEAQDQRTLIMKT